MGLTEVVTLFNLGIALFFGILVANYSRRIGKAYFGWFLYGAIFNVIALLHVFLMRAGFFRSLEKAFFWIFPERAYDPEVAKENAGLRAEDFVKRLLWKYIEENGFQSKLINGELFVFNKGTSNEYSAEVDHILITPRNMYVFETKYKSGNIWVDIDANSWKTEYNGRIGELRNPLAQVKNTAQRLSSEFRLPAKFIPIVVIFGEKTRLHGEPTNIISSEYLIETVSAFEFSGKSNAVLNVMEISDLLLTKIDRTDAARNKHIASISQKKDIARFQNIVNNASTEY